MNKELIAGFLREFAHFEDAEVFVDELPNTAQKLAADIYNALVEDEHNSEKFREVMREKWSGVLQTNG